MRYHKAVEVSLHQAQEITSTRTSALSDVVIVARGGVTLYQDLALEGIALHGVAAGIEQIGVAAENLAVPEQNDTAALAGAPIQQGDVDRIEPVLHDVPDAGGRAHGKPVGELCQSPAGTVNASG